MNKDGPMRAETWNNLIEYVRTLRILPSPHVYPTVGAFGTSLLSTSSRSQIISKQLLPWDLIATPDPESTAENPPYLVTVQPGTLSGFLPTNWDDEFTCNSTGLYYAKAVVSTDGTAITTVEIQIDTTPPAQQTPELWNVPNSVEYLFGLFSEGSVYRTIGPSHITLSPKVWITTEKEALPAPGELPYDYYYVLG
jgi:hypothetical protein